jgi:hypothetical protein
MSRLGKFLICLHTMYMILDLYEIICILFEFILCIYEDLCFPIYNNSGYITMSFLISNGDYEKNYSYIY